jgi:Cu(I)/Ag(I) efflux system periplasmic protein CusF
MAHASRVVIVTLALIVASACNNQPHSTQHPATTPAPSGPAAAVQTNSYPAVGVVKRIDPKLPAIEIDHEEIVGLMPAMQMEFPVTDGKLLNGLAVNDRIDFTVESVTGDMRVTAIKKK